MTIKHDTSDIATATQDFRLSLDLNLADKTKDDYCRIFRQLLTATKDHPIKIRSKGKWLQARAVQQAMIRGDFVSPNHKFPGLPDKWRSHEGSRAAKIRDQILAPEQFDQILALAPGQYGEQNRGAEFVLACKLGYYSGMRRGEIISLQPDQITITSASISIYIPGEHTKNAEGHTTYYPRRLEADLKGFSGFTLTGHYLSETFNRIAKKLGLKYVKFHSLRHTCATNWQNQGVDLLDIMTMLGHKNIATTLVYTKVSQTMPKALEKLNY